MQCSRRARLQAWTTHVPADLQSISLDQPLADRLIEAAETLEARLNRMGTQSALRTPPGTESHGDARFTVVIRPVYFQVSYWYSFCCAISVVTLV